jgi:hypothetical protein
MQSPERASGPWISLWVLAALSLVAQLALCQFFSFGTQVPYSIDIDPSNLWKNAYQSPPTGEFLVLNWLGVAVLPPPLNPFTLGSLLPAWWFFTAYAPVLATAALLMMAAFLREFGVSRPAALFGAALYAWQGDLLPFVFPGHFAYITTWFFFAAAAWGALRLERTGRWPYGLISGTCCGTMIGLAPDRGAIASLLIGALYLVPVLRREFDGRGWFVALRRLALCAGTALLVSLAAFLALFQSNIVGVKMGTGSTREETYQFVSQFCLPPVETLTYVVPGFFGWYSGSETGPYWGGIGEKADVSGKNPGLNLAISTSGTLAATLALLGAVLVLPGAAGRLPGPLAAVVSDRQKRYGRVLLALGLLMLVFAWGWHTGIYRVLFLLPLMDKWRDPLKWLEATNFALVTFSALGTEQVLAAVGAGGVEGRRARWRIAFFWAAALALLGLGLLLSYPFSIALSSVLQQESVESISVSRIMSLLHVSILAAFGTLACALVVFVFACRPDWMRRWRPPNPWLDRGWQRVWRTEHLPVTLAAALVAISTAQLAWVASNFVRPADLEWLTLDDPLLEALKNEGPQVRVSVAAQDPILNDLLQNQFAADNISCLEISAASRIPEDIATFLETFAQDPARLYFLAGVKNVALPQQEIRHVQDDAGLKANIVRADGYVLGPTDSPDLPSHCLVVLRDYLAKATFVPRAESPGDDKAMLARMKDPAWDPRATIFLSAPADVPASATNTMPGAATVTAYTPHDIAIDVQAPESGYVLVNDEYDPDWSARIDGRAVALLRADYIFRAVAVPAGRSRVTLHYAAHYRVAGLSLPTIVVNDGCDGVMLASWIGAGFLLRRRVSRK